MMKNIFTIGFCWILLAGFAGSMAFAEAETDRSGLRDPFKPLLLHTEPAITLEPLPAQKAPSTDLEKYDLHQFRVIGIVLGELGHYAVVRAPDGKSYMISTGTSIGKFEGEVIDISENNIRVQEIQRFWNGKETIVKELETALYVNPLETTPSKPVSRFVIAVNNK